MTTVKMIIDQLENFAPKSLAEDWDPIGLVFGSEEKLVNKVMVALDLDKDTLGEAKEKDVDFIITHHPLIFNALKTLNTNDSRRKEYIDLIKNDIALYSMHTNLDAADGGMNDWLADAIGLSENRDIVEVSSFTGFYKLNVFVPKEQTNHVLQALFEAGAGQVGDYSNVYYRTSGFGHFTPGEKSTPTEGTVGKNTKVKEERIEVLVPEKAVQKVTESLYKAHPYEEPVFDLFKLEGQKKEYGFGRVGDLEISTYDLVEQLKGQFNVDGIRYGSSNPSELKNRVAIFGGSGSKAYKEALNKGAEIFVTGDISYHTAQDMLRDGIDFIDAGHYIEQIMVPKLTEKLREFKKEQKWDIDIIESVDQKDVFLFK